MAGRGTDIMLGGNSEFMAAAELAQLDGRFVGGAATARALLARHVGDAHRRLSADASAVPA